MIEGQKMEGVEIPLPGAPLVAVYGPGGFVMCGYLDLETANKLGVAAAVVRGVKTIDDLLKAPIQGVSHAASIRGVQLGQSAHVALAKLT